MLMLKHNRQGDDGYITMALASNAASNMHESKI
jgi:hypothetical protein